MKKRLISMALVLLLCLSFAGSTFADTNDNDTTVREPTRGLTLTGGLTKVSGNTYTLWGRVSSTLTEDLYVRARLYRVVNGSEVYVTQISSSATDVFCRAAKNVTLVANSTYIVRLYGSGDTLEISGSRTQNT